MFWKGKNESMDKKEKKIVSLTELAVGEEAIVSEILGGSQIAHRIESLGLRAGKKITKLSQHLWRGPITIKVDRIKIAVGRGMAHKIMVER